MRLDEVHQGRLRYLVCTDMGQSFWCSCVKRTNYCTLRYNWSVLVENIIQANVKVMLPDDNIGLWKTLTAFNSGMLLILHLIFQHLVSSVLIWTWLFIMLCFGKDILYNSSAWSQQTIRIYFPSSRTKANQKIKFDSSLSKWFNEKCKSYVTT